jgi:hypothetical protein
MPLQIVNMGANPIRLVPYLPICQLTLAHLSCTPARLYGERELQSKYVHDDGGPSYWWRDKRIVDLHKSLGQVDISLTVADEIMRQIGRQEPEVIERLQRSIDRLEIRNFDNADAILDSFARREDRRRLWRGIVIKSTVALFPILFAMTLRAFLFSESYDVWHYFAAALTLVSLPFSIYAFNTEVGDHFGEREFQKLSGKVEG